MAKKNKKKIFFLLVLVAIVLPVLIVGFNDNLVTTEYTYTNSKIPAEFDGYKIVQISDYHNEDFSDNQSSFISAVNEANPDIIVLTGDIVDGEHPDIVATTQMIEGITSIAPTYYITGNHELMPDAAVQYEQLQDVMEEYGVLHLDNKSVTLTRDDSDIILSGLQYVASYIENHLPPADTEKFNILLYHGSDDFDLIAPYGYDLVLSGHAHGGLIRLPFIGGIIGNDGNFFPKYDAGVFQNGNSTLIANVGVGDAQVPRFNNRPEIVSILFNSED